MKRREFGRLAVFGGAALALAPTVALAADELEEIKKRGKLVVGVKADYPPFGFRAPNGDITGIGPDLAQDVAKRLGVKLQLVPVVASNRMQFLEQGRVDLLIATMNDTPERAKVIDFVKPDYYASGYNLMLPKAAKITSWSELKGKPVCAIQGSFYNKGAAEKFGLHTVAFTGVAAALTALKQGRCLGFLYDNTAIVGQLVKPEWEKFDMPLETQDAQPWGMAVRKGATKFGSFMSQTVKDWDKSGFILQLETKYGITHHSEFAEKMHQKYS